MKIRQPRKWTYDACRNISKTYETVAELKNSKFNGAYHSMRKNKWLDEFYPNREKHKPSFDYSSLTYYECKKIALTFESPSKLHKENPPIYHFSNKNNWLSGFYPNYKKPCPKRSYEDCKELVSKYEYFTDFRKQQESAYLTIIDNGWGGDLFKKLKRTRTPNKYWTYERCKEHALKHTKRKDLNDTAIQKIYKKRWFELLEHMEYQSSISKRYIYVFEFEDNHVYVGLSYNPEMRKYDHLNSIKEKSSVLVHIEKTNSKYLFKVLTGPLTVKDACHQECRYIDEYRNNGWVLLNRATGGNPGGTPIKWTYQKCKNKISEYKILRDFTNNESGCYGKILKKRWMELLEPLERRGEITKDYEYYLNRYPKVVKLIEENIPNNRVAKMAGCSISNVVVIKRFLRESKMLPNKEDLFLSKPQTLKIIELLKLKYPRADIMREANTCLSTILKVIKAYYEKTGIDLYYKYCKKNLHLKHHKPLKMYGGLI